MSVRMQVVKGPGLLKRLELRLVQALWRWQRATTRRLGADVQLRGGAGCFWPWFGSSLRLPPPDDAEVLAVLQRVLRLVKKDWAHVDAAWAEDDYEVLQQRTLQRPLALEVPPSPPSPPRRPARFIAARRHRGPRQ